eukprot:GFUD01014097.1.p1 GENE.GFUD01014097.1~~GFUD01014097.1.p1  ORF type:complete len:352 (-),score=72.11 GFUD01014097.1:39-1094(-)
MGSEKFCLRWNDFESNISTAFRELRDDKDFFDVTLACNGDQIQAHKVILSACSPFFRNILRRNPHQHPLLYLKGVKYTDLQSVLNFMYHGEVNVAQEELNSFLAVAEELSVKGLTQNQSSSTQSAKHDSYSPPKPQIIKPSISHPPDREPIPPPKRPRHTPAVQVPGDNHTIDDDEIQEVVPVKSEPRDPPPLTQPLPPAPQTMFSPQPKQSHTTHSLAPADDDQALAYPDDSYEDYGQYGDEQEYQGGGLAGMSGMAHPVATGVEGTEGHRQRLNECILKTEENGVVGYKCVLCGKTTQRKDALTNHIENIHFPGSYQCHYCDQVFNSQNTRNVHIGRKHKFNPASTFKI